VISHATSTRRGSCGLMVGMNCAPPPPGPITLHLRSAGTLASASSARTKQSTRTLPISIPSPGLPQHPPRVIAVDLLQDSLLQPEPVQRPLVVEQLVVVEVFVLRLQDTKRRPIHLRIEPH